MSDYYAFGMLMVGRNWSAGEYRYGFNGKESDNEVSGVGNQYDYGFRIYDARIAKFLSVDPLSPKYPFYTPYQFASNTPISAIDVDGLESNIQYNLVEIQAPRSGADPEVQSLIRYFANNPNQWEAYKKGIYNAFLAPHTNWVGKMLYGCDGQGNVNVPEKYKKEAREYVELNALPLLKKGWAQIKAGSGSGFTYEYYNALTVSSKEEGKALLKRVGVEVAAKWATHIILSGSAMLSALKGGRGASFYTVQSGKDASRLMNSKGLPWPSEAERSGLGEGGYAWKSLTEAQEYQKVLAASGIETEILEFRVSYKELSEFNTLRFGKMSQSQIDDFMSSQSKIWGGTPTHDFEYIVRPTSMGNEHFFSSKVYNSIKFSTY